MFDKRSFQLSGQIVGDIDSYIDANYVRESQKKEYPVRSRSGARIRELSEEAFYEEMLQREAEDNYPIKEDRVSRALYAVSRHFFGRPACKYWRFIS